MQIMKLNRGSINPFSNKSSIPILILIVLVSVGWYAFNIYRASQENNYLQGTVTISHTILEGKYGVRVNLVAVTAAGGFVDVRLEILDKEKAKSLLQDPQSFPSLFVDNVSLNVSQEAKERGVELENNGNLFMMFSNAGNTVKQGTPVTILFGDIALEPINAK